MIQLGEYNFFARLMSRLRRNSLGSRAKGYSSSSGIAAWSAIPRHSWNGPRSCSRPPAIQGGWRLQIEGACTSALGSLTAFFQWARQVPNPTMGSRGRWVVLVEIEQRGA